MVLKVVLIWGFQCKLTQQSENGRQQKTKKSTDAVTDFMCGVFCLAASCFKSGLRLAENAAGLIWAFILIDH